MNDYNNSPNTVSFSWIDTSSYDTNTPDNFDWNEYHELVQVSNNENDMPPLLLDDLRTENNMTPFSFEEPSNNVIKNIIMYTIDKKIPCTDDECPICYESIPYNKKVTTNCNHVFCSDCITHYFDTCYDCNSEPVCAMCREPYSTLEVQDPDTCENMCKHTEKYLGSESQGSEYSNIIQDEQEYIAFQFERPDFPNEIHPNVTIRRTMSTVSDISLNDDFVLHPNVTIRENRRPRRAIVFPEILIDISENNNNH